MRRRPPANSTLLVFLVCARSHDRRVLTHAVRANCDGLTSSCHRKRRRKKKKKTEAAKATIRHELVQIFMGTTRTAIPTRQIKWKMKLSCLTAMGFRRRRYVRIVPHTTHGRTISEPISTDFSPSLVRYPSCARASMTVAHVAVAVVLPPRRRVYAHVYPIAPFSVVIICTRVAAASFRRRHACHLPFRI